jgi:hypothetical protein
MCVASALVIDWLDAAASRGAPRPAGRPHHRLPPRAPRSLIAWRERNRHALREFWAHAPADALGARQEFEKALAQNGKPPK